MKTISAKILLSFIITAFVIQSSYGQDSLVKGNVQLRVFGFGLHVQQFNVGDILLSSSDAPVTTIILTFNINNVFRIEPEFGIISSDGIKDTKFGIGLYGMFQYGNLNMTAGARYESHSTTDDMSSKGFGPVLGGEYFFGNHFSFGGNVGVMFASVDETTYYPSGEITTKYTYTSTGLTAKFYF